MITQLKIFNLKNTESKTIELTGKDIIQGNNGYGKTTILNAIEFALTGKIGLTNRTDGYTKKGEQDIQVIAHLTKDGINHIINRKGKTLTLNGSLVTQNELEKILGFNSLELIASAFSGYFMRLDEDEKASLLNISDIKEVAKKFITQEQLETYNIDLNNLDNSAVKIAKLQKENDTLIQFLNNEIYLLNQQIVQDEEKLANIKEDPSIKEKLDELKKKKEELLKDNANIRNKVSAESDATTKERIKLVNDFQESVKQYDKQVSDIELKNKEIEEKFKLDSEALEEERATEYKKFVKGQSENIRCPNCKTFLGDKGFTHTNILDEFKFDKTIQSPSFLPIPAKPILDLSQLDNIVNLMKLTLERLTPDNFYDVDIKELEVRLEQSGQQDLKNALIKDIEDKKNKVKSNQDRLANMNSIELDLIHKALKKEIPNALMELAEAKLLESLPEGYTVELYEKFKTSDRLKYQFKIFYNGIAYDWLSAGEKIITDIYLCQYFQKKFGYDMIYIDDANLLDPTNLQKIKALNKYLITWVNDKSGSNMASSSGN